MCILDAIMLGEMCVNMSNEDNRCCAANSLHYIVGLSEILHSLFLVNSRHFERIFVYFRVQFHRL